MDLSPSRRGTDRYKTSLNGLRIGTKRVKGGECEKLQTGSLLGSNFF
jgi:hypothetical protein